MKHSQKYIKKSSKLHNNHKGLSGPALIATFILVFIMVFGLIVLYQKVMKGGTKVLDCKSNGGDCVTNTCDFVTQVPALSDKAAGCKSGELCCINITKSKPADPLCANLTEGDSCGKTMYCDAGKQCVTKCEFCSNNWYVDWGRKVCEPDTNTLFKFNSEQKKHFSCNCTISQCVAKEGKDPKECIRQFCPTTTPEKYCCTGS